MTRHRIAVIPGDGIGKEVMPEGIRVLEAAGKRFDIAFEWDRLDWSCETYKATGRMMPADGLARIAKHDAIFLGAVGFPGVPDHISLWGLLIPIRRQFRQYVNLRPVCLLKGVASPLAGVKPGDVLDPRLDLAHSLSGRPRELISTAHRQRPLLQREAVDVGVLHGISLDGHLYRESGIK